MMVDPPMEEDLASSVRLSFIDGEVLIAGVPAFIGSTEELIDRVWELADSAGPELVVTPNVDQVLDLKKPGVHRDAYLAARLRLIDGMPLVRLARALGARQAQRHTGADLLPRVVSASRDASRRIAIFGGGDSISERAAERLREVYAGADVVSLPFPYVSSVSDPACQQVVDELWRLDPDVVFICLGAPKQEAWFMHWREALPAALYVGAGAAVDFAAGTKVRAPRLVQAVSLEWLWRMAQEPRRLFARYILKGPLFIKVVVDSARLRHDIDRRRKDSRGL